MELSSLKQFILDEKIANDLLVFQYEDGNAHFVANQYANAICEQKNLQKVVVPSLAAIEEGASSYTHDTNSEFYIIHAENFNEVYPSYYNFKNTIIICNKIDKKIEAKLSDFIVKFPKLQNWQIEDYIRAQAPNISADNAQWLNAACTNNLYRIQNEVDKVVLFKDLEQQEVLEAIKDQPNSDLFVMSIFELADAVIKCDVATLFRYFKHRNNCDIEPMGLVITLLKKCRDIVLILGNSGLSAAEIGVSDRAIWAIKKSYAYCSIDKLRENIKFLTDIDYKLKTGALELSKEAFTDYIICGCLRNMSF